jgi:beta-galactosidase/evolved beta-galactosidase subunit alpha
MLLANGIFRDVYILFSNKTALKDWEIITDDKTFSLKAWLFESADAVARVEFMGNTVEIPFKNGKIEYSCTPENVKTWNAEQPNLYDLFLEIVEGGKVIETHSKRVGFVTSVIKKQQFLVNGKPVLFKGINRHENNAENGRYITVKQIEDDLKLIKKHNINAIRCAHYPNNPAFYEIASELGIYVMDEGDLESHGCGITGDQGFLNKTPSWLNAFMDRTVRMAERDKNESCVVIWSVGNEIGVGENSEACAEYLRNREDKKPVSYSAANKDSQAFVGNGYCNINKLETILNNANDTEQPLCLIEYAHAMGNSPGNMQRIWDYVMEHPRYAGGFVWEFRNHGKKRVNDDGTVDYLYGGDFYDDNHWSNFTLDGFCVSDGTPKPTFLELKYIYAPVRFKYENGVLNIHNTRDFISTKTLKFEAEISCDGKVISTEELLVPEIMPRQKADITYKPEYAGTDCFLTLRVYENDDIVALKQFALEKTVEKPQLVPEKFEGECVLKGHDATVTGNGFKVDFANGVPVYYKKGEKEYFKSPMRIMTYRAETDNDGIVGLYPRWIGSWEKARLQKMELFTVKTRMEQSDDCVKIYATAILTADHCYMGFNMENVYTVYNDGLLNIEMTVKPFGDMPKYPGFGSAGEYDTPFTPRLPRFGACFELETDFDTVKWFGRGEDHNYTDSISSAPVGVYELPIEKLNFQYDVPQETGTRIDNRYIAVKNGKEAFAVYGNDCFSFSYHPWHIDNLRAARHISDLKRADKNFLYIDYRMRALGSYSCGPNPEVEDDFEPHDFRFVFSINGENGDGGKYKDVSIGNKTEKLSDVYVRVKIETEREVIECRAQEE